MSTEQTLQTADTKLALEFTSCDFFEAESGRRGFDFIAGVAADFDHHLLPSQYHVPLRPNTYYRPNTTSQLSTSVETPHTTRLTNE